MGKESSDAPLPDPNISQSAAKQASTGEGWLNFATGAYNTAQQRQAGIDATAQTAANSALATQTAASSAAAKDRATYEGTFTPLLNSLTSEALNYASPENQAAAAATAGADAQTAIGQQNAATERQQSAMGVNPASGRFQGVQRAQALNGALGIANAKNQAREGVRDKATALQTNAANLASTTNTSALNYSNLANQSGLTATNNLTAANQQSLAANNIMNTGYAGALSGYQGQASTLGNLYGQQLNAWSAQQQADAAETSGIYGALGTGIGLLSGGTKPWVFSSSKEIKEDKAPIADGEALTAIESMPVERWRYMPGIEDGGEHIGPYAEDMQRVTGLGDGKGIAVQDAIGLTMKAVQDVSKKVDRISQMVGLGAFPGRAMEEEAA